MQQTEASSPLISAEDYLTDELRRDKKHEFIDGHIVMMADASINHERISVNILTEFRNHLKSSPCEPLGSDMKVKIGSNFFYPDAMVDCHFDESRPYYTESPSIIVEVIRRSEGWVSKHYFLGDTVTLESSDLSLSVAEIYHRVNNEDMGYALKTGQVSCESRSNALHWNA
ncbi:MAG: Uma2 family endonuclease [Methyloprofundus sp.]|nr:Uma2 family endonuclease [Methyloprofundus sp.]